MSRTLRIGAVSAVLGLVPATLLLSAGSASAQEEPCSAFSMECGDAVVAEQEVRIGARDPAGTPETPTGEPAVTGATPCTYRSAPDGFDQRTDVAVTAGIPARAVYYIRDCGTGDEWRWYVPGSGETNDEDVSALVSEAFDVIQPPAPALVTAPPLGSEVLTGLPLHLAVDDEAFAEHRGSVSAGAFTVTAHVRPVETVFAPGDQHEAFVCRGAGTRWSHGDRPTEDDCTHTYTHTPAHLHGSQDTAGYSLTGRVTYAAWYTVEGPILAGSYELGSFEGPETVVEVPVVERRAVRTSGAG
jgi:hypothetical protein